MIKIIDIGITATRIGMSLNQKTMLIRRLQEIIDNGYYINFHHGACEGGDVEADQICRNLKIGNPNKTHGEIHIHPSDHAKTRVHCEQDWDTVYPPKPPLTRDRDIVSSIDFLFAAPKNEKKEELRSGTWTTVRYARKQNVSYELLCR
jgi:hypothetical protein